MPSLYGTSGYGSPTKIEESIRRRRRREPRSLSKSLGYRSPRAKKWATNRVVDSILNKGYAGYDGEQGRVVNTILSRGERQGATQHEKLAALETGLTEANLRNPNHGDRDSVGFRQERSHYGSAAERMNVDAAATRLFSEMQSVQGRDLLSPGQLAQTVQRSAYPERYDQRQGEANSLLAEWDRRTKGGLDKAIASSDRVPRGGAKATPQLEARRAVLSNIPKAFRDEGRHDERTPAENTRVGGSATSDHLTTNPGSYAADLPADDEMAQEIASSLGMKGHTGYQTVTRDGIRYQMIWRAPDHYDHVHFGAKEVDSGPVPASGTYYAGGPGELTGLVDTVGAELEGSNGLKGLRRLSKLYGELPENVEDLPPEEALTIGEQLWEEFLAQMA